MEWGQSFRIRNQACRTIPYMGQLRQRLAQELKRRRGEMSYRDFAQQLGISKTSLYRIEMGEQNVGVDMIEQLCWRLHCKVSDLLGDDDD